MMKKIINSKDKILKIFILIQPFLDVLIAFLIYNNINSSITSVIRILFMLFIILLLFVTNYKGNRRVLTYLIITLITIFIHTILMIFTKDMSVVTYELKNTISTYYFVFLLLGFISLYKSDSVNKKDLMKMWIIYLLLTFIPNILGIGFKSYSHSKTGMTGWFYSANVVGSIIVIILPLIFSELKKIPFIFKVMLSIIFVYTIFSLGTKTPVLALIIILITNILYYLYKLVKRKEKKKILILLTTTLVVFISGLIVIPRTSFYENLKIHYNYLEKNNVKVLSKEFLDHFIFSQRLSMEERTRGNYNKGNLLEKLFGIGYIENYGTDEVNLKTVEMDYFDIFYREGIVGFMLIFIPVVYSIVVFIKNFSFDFNKVNELTSLILILLLALFQGHIFLTPQISVYISLIFNIINKGNYGKLVSN